MQRAGSRAAIQLEHAPLDQERWLELESFEAPFLQEKLMDQGTFFDAATYGEAFSEWKRYMALLKWTDGVAMTSPAVDAVWHQFILFTKE